MSKKPNIIQEKSLNFAIRIVNLHKFLKEEKKEYVMSKQLLRCGTAVGALVREAEHAESSADFVHKLTIAQKEANEADYWLELLVKTNYLDNEQFLSLTSDIKEMKKILASIIITSKEKLNKPKKS